MNKWTLGALAAGLLVATSATAGLNPASPGLPLADAWGQTGVLSNGASSMCVDCHTANPLTRRTDANGKYAWQTPHTDFLGSHYVGTATNSGGGQANATWGLAPRTGAEYFRLDVWQDGGTDVPGRVSKYADFGGTPATTLSYVTDNTVIANATLEAATDAAPGAYAGRDIVCESCHSIVTNKGGISGRNLLGGTVLETESATMAGGKVVGGTDGDTEMCEQCHGDLQRNTTRSNNSPDGNNHHVLTLTSSDGTYTANRIEDAKAADRLLWTRANVATGPDRDMSTGPTYAGEMLEVGYRVQTGAMNWDNGLAGIRAATFNCTDCHAFGHGGRTDTGARLFRAGENGTDDGDGDGTVHTEAGVNTGTGLDRLTDMVNRGTPDTTAATVWQDDQGYCEGCHYYAK